MEASFARHYFSYTSPPPISKPQELQIAPYTPAGRAPLLCGVEVASLDELKAMTTGALTVTMANHQQTFNNINLTSATCYADIASLVQQKINTDPQSAFATVVVAFDSLSSTFKISGGMIEPTNIQVDSSMLADAMGLSQGKRLPGSHSQTPLEAFMAAEKISDSFGSATFLEILSHLSRPCS